MLLCGSDLVNSFLRPGVWKPEHLRSIFEEHGVVCISRCFTFAKTQTNGRWLLSNKFMSLRPRKVALLENGTISQFLDVAR